MLATVRFWAPDLVRTGRDPLGKRKYLIVQLEPLGVANRLPTIGFRPLDLAGEVIIS